MRLVALLAVLALAATPTLARERCDLPENNGFQFKGGFRVGSPYTAEEQALLDSIELRRQGVNARIITRTADGCIEAWAPDGQGGMTTYYFDPRSFELKLD